MKLSIATSQFPVSADIHENKENILGQMSLAKERGCNIIHFPEGSLSGYAGIDFSSFDGYNWVLLKESMLGVINAARQLSIWVVLGSSHQLTGSNKPHNSLYIITADGNIEDRYDKLFCAGNDSESQDDLAHYSSGNHFTLFVINGVKCGTLICHDFRYPELYRELKKHGVQLVFHSYHAGNIDEARRTFMESQVGDVYFNLNPGRTIPEITMPASMISYAANNHVWISCSNTSAADSCFASFMVRPDGVITGRLEKHQPGILVTEIDFEQPFYDSTKYWRNRAISGIYHSGSEISDPRSQKRQEL
ncbi:carbon-nitrogen hydrolase family protein [Paradesertivirga mongoliensis]|uniref:Carbon-nitrogen hydrolase family protein n=1 Tax=Paradesertivirga mongoliensis TaxID=2100740 RepID=A0ABW4ZL45_9SPHI|nr:carbon-nitrogen hydrolase family protein [Pedobacter mongoliensis]